MSRGERQDPRITDSALQAPLNGRLKCTGSGPFLSTHTNTQQVSLAQPDRVDVKTPEPRVPLF